MERGSSIQATESQLNFTPEVGMKIFLDTNFKDSVCTPIVIAQPGAKVTQEDFEAAYRVNQGLPTDHKPFVTNFFTDDIWEILEVGEGDQAGFIKVHIHGRSELNEGWIDTNNRQFNSYKWSINRRKGEILQGDRLDEICDPNSNIVLRCKDDIRKFTIAAMQRKGEIAKEASSRPVDFIFY